jgi:hypothetical protein
VYSLQELLSDSCQRCVTTPGDLALPTTLLSKTTLLKCWNALCSWICRQVCRRSIRCSWENASFVYGYAFESWRLVGGFRAQFDGGTSMEIPLVGVIYVKSHAHGAPLGTFGALTRNYVRSVVSLSFQRVRS